MVNISPHVQIKEHTTVHDVDDYSEDVLEINEEVLNQNHKDMNHERVSLKIIIVQT